MNKKIIIALSLTIVAVLLVGFFTIKKANSSTVTIEKFPSSLVVTIDGKEYSNTTVSLEKGTYTITGKQDGFDTVEQTVDLRDGDKTVQLFTQPNNEVGEKWVRDNADEVQEFEKQAGEASQLEGEKQRKEHPIVEHLPITGFGYTIGYKDNDKGFVVVVRADERSLATAMDVFKDINHNPVDYTIEFPNLRSVFDE